MEETVMVPMCTDEQSVGVLTHRDLIRAWMLMLKAQDAMHVEVDPDELLYGHIDVTQIHYAQKDMHNPLTQAFDYFERTRWSWKRLKDRLKRKC